MSELKVRTRETGAVAKMAAGKLPVITTPTGGTVEIVTSVSQPGFNPLDLIYSSVAACMALSARIAAGKLELRDRLSDLRVEVKGEKAHEEPSRIERFDIAFHFEGDLTDDEKHRIAKMAKQICTISNTLRGDPQFTLTVR
ncbi:putative OsmC-like protein [Ochrobactrum daejeonense]|uniref:Putative OsmC-like protein n=1 Tax=Brucella daejeonensis TaxID=659015 RepID=A0A7W9AZ92_9HYPH|nr:OsmC family protein [Brucella daejeonensis]MBB5703177.1 putative OsmC-like protein [Brucella daejeonensis]